MDGGIRAVDFGTTKHVPSIELIVSMCGLLSANRRSMRTAQYWQSACCESPFIGMRRYCAKKRAVPRLAMHSLRLRHILSRTMSSAEFSGARVLILLRCVLGGTAGHSQNISVFRYH